MDALHAEFPGAAAALGRIRRPSVHSAPAIAGVVDAFGAAFLVRPVMQLLLIVVSPVLFPPTEPRPSWLPPSLPAFVGEMTAGAVATRTAGVVGLLAYLGAELATIAAQLPVRAFTCSRALGSPEPFACDWVGMVGEHRALWLAVAIGAALYRALAVRGEGANTLLRAAGAFALVSLVFQDLAQVAFVSFFPTVSTTFLSATFLLAAVASGLVAGALLSRARSAAVLLLALLVGALPLATSVRILQLNMPPYLPSFPPLFDLFAPVLTPVAAAAAIFTGRLVGSRWNRRLAPQ